VTLWLVCITQKITQKLNKYYAHANNIANNRTYPNLPAVSKCMDTGTPVASANDNTAYNIQTDTRESCCVNCQTNTAIAAIHRGFVALFRSKIFLPSALSGRM
jgi:hypothetical protein